MRVETKTKQEFINHANNVLAYRDLEVIDVDWHDTGTKRDFKILVRCKKCGFEKYSTLKSMDDKRRSKCVRCESYQIPWNNDRLLTHESMLNENMGISIILSKTNIKSSNSYVYCRCNHDGFEWRDTVHNIINGNKRKCSICNKNGSKYELEAKAFFDNNKIKYIREHSFDGMKSINGHRKCRYDFYLPDYNMIVEIHGEQHFKASSTFGRVSKEEAEIKFKNNIRNDKRKMEYVINNGIRYIMISYRDNISNRLKEVLSTYGKNI